MPSHRLGLWILGLASLAGASIAACGGSGGGSSQAPDGGATDATADDGIDTSTEFDIGPDDTAPQTLAIAPLDPVIDATGAPVKQPFKAILGGVEATSVTWSLDDVVVGTIDGGGSFTAGGLVAGKAKVTAQVGSLTASTTVTVRVNVIDNGGGVTLADQVKLRTAGTADASFRWLYPYDATIFPRGLDAPVLQLAGTAADATRVTMSAGDFHYEGFFPASTPVKVTLPAKFWDAATKSTKGTDKLEVTVSKLSAGAVTGPVKESWGIAQGSLKGVIYYNTYLSKLANGGAVMRVRPGSSAQVVKAGCTVCHSVSAQGNVLASGLDWSAGNPIKSGTFDLDGAGNATTRYTSNDGRSLSFAALTPDGARALTNAIPASGSPIRGLTGALPSSLVDTATGAVIPAPSLGTLNALTPAFAPDGKQLAFNDWDVDGGKTLAVMDFAGAVTPPVFSNRRAIAHATRNYVAWPSFVPDGKAVLFHDGDGFDTGQALAHLQAEVRLVDLANGNAISPLYALNGRDASGAPALPYGDVEEGSLDYEPTVLPLAVGGYYWVVFTSRRCYGNTIAPGGTAGGADKWGTNTPATGEVPSIRKKLWVAALDLTATPGKDRSHPAFYLPGQELEAGNMRAFAALEPCKADGGSCESGADCCGGFCRPATGDAGAGLVCVPKPTGCSHEDESCSVTADCCDAPAGYACINGRCTRPTPG
jgi:hypothetical protein